MTSVPAQENNQTGVHNPEFDEIIYHVSHDVRACLRALKVLPSWLREELESHPGGITDPVREVLDMMEQQAERGDRMLLDLRTYSRVGRLSENPAIVPIRQAIKEAVNEVEVPLGFALLVDLDVQALKFARNELVLLFATLISNAIKHNDKRGGAIRINAAGDNAHVWITVSDDGPGIDRKFRERVFDLMTTLKPRDECEGSGLGLAIARKIVTGHGGTIEITDTGNQRGTTLLITLPATCAALATIG